ncbi:hypothetical protein DIS18_09145 [Algibacter marinivivus]|uniref:SGNH/GDSL hydrolase family protein n=1 Tax=Algibacter marinivivus TaxID=2100723 RepID=A0A2U2X3R8_9FLAO|nr:hypothetical protein [Algibacter marinivivus]PWH82409.1 hypothetical protein DIS18_09145 [Algibacter marinivivus]
MKRLFLKSILYVFLIIISLEVIVRAFHLYKEVPIRYIDEFGVEKSLPSQTGFAVTGNRKQNYSEYRINDFGFNSFREFLPTKENIEIALIGDSFVEGFHQDYYDSTGKKVEDKLHQKNIQVYEYGYGGYDLANQLHIIEAYIDHFKLIDHIIMYIKFEEDLDRSEYIPNKERINMLKSPLFKLRDKFKLLSYTSEIGIVDPVKNMALKMVQIGKSSKKTDSLKTLIDIDKERLKNFKTLINTYKFDKKKITFLTNIKTTSAIFINYCKENNFEIIDYGTVFEESKKTPTLIYDQHWNNHGRDLVASEISSFLKKKLNLHK